MGKHFEKWCSGVCLVQLDSAPACTALSVRWFVVRTKMKLKLEVNILKDLEIQHNSQQVLNGIMKGEFQTCFQ
jgi:hypothetical protein